MGLFAEIAKEYRLSESVSLADASVAIDNHEVIIAQYNSEGEEIGEGPRVIEPHALGLTKKGFPVIRAFERTGDSRSGIVPGWKFMRLDRFSSWKPTGQTFSRPASEYYKNLGEFNPNGDLTMSVVYKVAKFGYDEQPSPTQDSGPKTKSGDIYKTDTEKRNERLMQQLNNPIYISDLKTQNAIQAQTPQTDKESGPRTKDGGVDVYKTDTEKGVENLRKQLEHPIYLSDLQFNNKNQPSQEEENKDDEELEKNNENAQNQQKVK